MCTEAVSILSIRIPPVSITENGKEKSIVASAWLDRNRPVEQMTWAPGKPRIIMTLATLSHGWRTGCSAPKRRSITRWFLAAQWALSNHHLMATLRVSTVRVPRIVR